MLLESGERGPAEALYRTALIRAESTGNDLRVAVVLQSLGTALRYDG